MMSMGESTASGLSLFDANSTSSSSPNFSPTHMMADANTATATPMDMMDNLYPALVECFGIILMGYLASKFELITETEAKGLNTFVANFSLPALIFGSLCKLDLTSVNWLFLFSVFLAKALLFFLVLVVSLVTLRPLDAARSGIYAIFVTQSNDFALGYPILKAIYGKSHPDYPDYLYLMAPISLVMLNPIGFVCMEIGKAASASSEPDHQSHQPNHVTRVLNVLKSVASNPILFMTVAGVVGNVAFQQTMPSFLDQFLTTLGSAFSASALFLLGVRMIGSGSNASSEERAIRRRASSRRIVPFILILLKTVALPLITREIVSTVGSGHYASNETEQLSNFAFLYGTFPTAPSVFVYAAKYNIETEMLANAMVACTFIAAPIMFVSARLLSIPDLNPSDYTSELDTFLFDVSIISILAVVWLAFVFVVTRKWCRIPHYLTLVVIFCQGVACVGATFWSVMNCTHGVKLYLQFTFLAFGVYGTRINTALLAVQVLMLQIKPICTLVRWKRAFLALGLATPIALTLSLVLFVARETKPHGEKTDPNFQYGETQAWVALGVLVISFLVTVTAMILTQRYRRKVTYLSPARHPGPSNSGPESEGDRAPLLDSDTEELESPSNSTFDVISRAAPIGSEEGLQPEALSIRRSARGSPTPIEDLLLSRPPSRGCVSGGCGNGNRVINDSGESGHDVRGGSGRRRYRCDTEHQAYCSALLQSYTNPPALEARDETVCQKTVDEHQIYRHTVLLLLLATSMFIGIALCIWTLVMDNTRGLYLELVFLDGFLNFGQALFSLSLFGLDSRYLLVPMRRWYRRLRYGADSLVLPHWEDLEEETKHHCQLFLKHHVSKCVEAVVGDVKIAGLGLLTQRAVFRGSHLVDWLLEVDIARNRADAVTYARHLVKGRVIRHVDNYLDFHDDDFIYTFEPEPGPEPGQTPRPVGRLGRPETGQSSSTAS